MASSNVTMGSRPGIHSGAASWATHRAPGHSGSAMPAPYHPYAAAPCERAWQTATSRINAPTRLPGRRNSSVTPVAVQATGAMSPSQPGAGPLPPAGRVKSGRVITQTTTASDSADTVTAPRVMTRARMPTAWPSPAPADSPSRPGSAGAPPDRVGTANPCARPSGPSMVTPRPSRGPGMSIQRSTRTIATVAACLGVVAAAAVDASAGADRPSHVALVGRAVLPVETYADGPRSGTFLPPGVVNGITFPLLSQPVQGFSSIVDGRQPGEYLAMPDNGYGSKSSSKDFHIRAYYLRPDLKTANGGTGPVQVARPTS